MVKKRSKRLDEINRRNKILRELRMYKLITVDSYKNGYNNIIVNYKGCDMTIKNYVEQLSVTKLQSNITTLNVDPNVERNSESRITNLSVIPIFKNGKFCEIFDEIESQILNELNSIMIRNQIREICDETRYTFYHTH